METETTQSVSSNSKLLFHFASIMTSAIIELHLQHS